MTTIYTENKVDDALINEIKEVLLKEAKMKVVFNVTGRSKHVQLSHEAEAQLPQFDFSISYWDYKCVVYSKA